jgi:hypothetical protein
LVTANDEQLNLSRLTPQQPEQKAAPQRHRSLRFGIHKEVSPRVEYGRELCARLNEAFSCTIQRWVSCRPGFVLPVRVLSRLLRRLFLEKLVAAHQAGRLSFFGDHAPLAACKAFAAYLRPLRKVEWVVYSKRPFGGPEAVLAYLSRYTHRVAISNSRLISVDNAGVTFKWKDYRAKLRERQRS